MVALMTRICEHILNEEEKGCKICGTNLLMINNGCSCIWRDIPDERTKEIRPEPTEREYAIYDGITISSRILELKIEKDNMINHVNEDSSDTNWDGLLA